MPVLTRLVLDWCNKYGKTRDLETVCYSLAGNPDCDYKVIIFEIELTKSMFWRGKHLIYSSKVRKAIAKLVASTDKSQVCVNLNILCILRK